MEFTGFSAGTLSFLAELVEHQDRTWFAENRERYESELLGRQRAFVDAVGARFAEIDPRVRAVPAVNKSIFRINRDTRFSRDKSPYKTYADVFFWIGSTRKSDPGYFMRIIPEGLWIGCGAHSMSPEQIVRLRSAIVAPASGEEFAELLAGLAADGFGIGEKTLARVPAGFSADAPRADLLRMTVVHAIEVVSPVPKEFFGPEFVDWSMERFLHTRPLVDWLVEHVGS